MTIGKKMYVYFGCCSLIPFIVMAVIAYNSASKSLRVQAENNLVRKWSDRMANAVSRRRVEG